MYHRRGYQNSRRRHISIVDCLLLITVVLSMGNAAAPLMQDVASSHESQRIISQMTSVSDETMDPRRKALLHEAQAFNDALAGGDGGTDNAGMRGGNEGEEDILSLAEPGDEPTIPYEHQLSNGPGQPLCWVEVPAASVAEPVYHTTTDEVLAQGVGHLVSSSLPVGGTSSHCVLAGHSGMEHAHMFDHLGEVRVGDVIILHTLGDAYWYEVCQTEVVTPREAEQRCEIAAGEDLCTLVTCTPYGINSHRLLVRARRIAAQSVRPRKRSAYRPVGDRRSAPPLVLACLSGMPLIVGFSRRLRRHHRELETSPEVRHIPFGRTQPVLVAAPKAHPSAARPRALSQPRAPVSSQSPHRTTTIGDCRNHRSWIGRLGVPLGTILLLSAGAIAGHLAQEGAGYRRLEQNVVLDDTAEEGDDRTNMLTIDWDILRDINPETVAWVEVDGTDISLPVVAPRDGDMAYYLRHNLWKQWSLQGTPFLDHRCGEDDPHRIVYGHHLSTGGQFSQLQRAYEQVTFNALGTCCWSTPHKPTRTFAPLCALSVDQWCEIIQHFAFADKNELHAWLEDLCNNASARSQDWRGLVGETESVLTLVTCSSELSNQPWRTLVVFVEMSAEKDPR